MKPSYERQEGESKQAFKDFVIYRNLGITRNLKDVGKKLGKNYSLIKRWSSQHNWVERAGAFDKGMDRKLFWRMSSGSGEKTLRHLQVISKSWTY